MRRLPRVCRGALAVALIFAGCAYSLTSGGRVNLQRARKIYSDVQELRQLNFKYEIPMVLMDRAQAAVALQSLMARHRSPAELHLAADAGVLTGLYASESDLSSRTLLVLKRQVLAFYEPQSRQMILVKSPAQHWPAPIFDRLYSRRDAREEMLVAHELDHALEDQYFGVQTQLDEITDNDDRVLALKAIAEGDASLVGYGYSTGLIDAETIHSLLAHLEAMPQWFDLQSPDFPPVLRDSLIFQYTDGTRFVGTAYERGGWNAVNALYRNPPVSTRQIIDPALYFEHPSPPLKIAVAGWQQELPHWRKAAENTYGALLLRVILTHNSQNPVDGSLWRAWRGDRMVVLQNGRDTTVIWMIAMSDEVRSAALAQAYDAILARLSSHGAPRAYHVERRGIVVLAIIGPGAAQSLELAPALWRASTIRDRSSRRG